MRTLVICLAFCMTCFPAAAERRALIVGVQAYDEVTPLSRTLADVEGYGEVFSDDLNFEVTQLIEPTFETFLQGLSTFTASVGRRRGRVYLLWTWLVGWGQEFSCHA